MFFVFSKVLHFLIAPVSWIFILLLFSFLWKKHARKLRLFAVVTLFLFGNSFLLHEVNLLWEYPMVKDEELKPHQVGVVLGGYAYYNPENDRVVFRENTDRLLQALRLLKTGKIDKLILSGGSGFLLKPEQKEAEYVGEFLEELGFRKRDIILEPASRNTHENAQMTAALLQNRGWDKQRILLVTSARHMRRAQGCFEARDISITPFPTDNMTGKREYGLDHLLIPSAYTLAHWNVLLHEWLGYTSYWIMGYL